MSEAFVSPALNIDFLLKRVSHSEDQLRESYSFSHEQEESGLKQASGSGVSLDLCYVFKFHMHNPLFLHKHLLALGADIILI